MSSIFSAHFTSFYVQCSEFLFNRKTGIDYLNVFYIILKRYKLKVFLVLIMLDKRRVDDF